MSRRRLCFLTSLALVVSTVSILPPQAIPATQPAQRSATIQAWRSPARLHHGSLTIPGTLMLNEAGIHFRPLKGAPLNWTFPEIQTFYLTPHELKVRSYVNRGWHLPGVKTFRFTLASAVPPRVAAELATRVGKPSRNADPDPNLPGFANLPARHPALLGGSNGVLRFDQNGINYMAAPGSDSRSWRWEDIQTLAHPDPYHLTVGGYRETYSFELKQPMSEALFDQLWDYVYARGLQLGIHSGRDADNSRPDGAGDTF
ncbi:MAG TPA: hypothetical protein VGX94_13180 [Terriglobia bacterium]|nr:hypothetical protein [Terriglobia bacterium]